MQATPAPPQGPVPVTAPGAPAEGVGAEATPISAGDAVRAVEAGGLHLSQEMQLTFGLMAFGLFALLFLYLISRRREPSAFLLRIYVITIIVFGTLAVVASAYTTDQIAPVVGLFGTIAGYVLGRGERNASPTEGDPPRAGG